MTYNEYDITRWQTTKYSDLTERVSYSYDELHNVKEITVDINNARSYNIQYKRDNGKLMAEKRSGAYALNKSYSYGADGGLNSVSYKAACGLSSYQYPDSAQELTYVFETDNTPDKRNSKVTLPFGVEQKFAYDGLGRTREIALGEKLVKNIYYQKFGDHATNRVSTVWYGVNGIRKDSLKYTYDKAGNITAITENGVVIARYVYDGLNRLICENNYQLSEKIKYGYDSAGNILCKSVNGKKYKYSYPQSGWKDQLLSFNNEMDGINESCEYDALGNPTTYRGRTLVWRGRRLISYGKGAKRATYTYDANSVRTSKTVTDGINTLTSEFIYDGNNLIAERREGKWIYYLYGVDGIAGFRYEGVTYLYRKNIQGDITHIYDIRADGSLIQVAHYAYDAFGNVKELQENSAISKLNPFRYRGYYYDTETKLYYLISRYYDPETGRFISADGIEYLDPETLGGLNLYAYCGNNPVMNVDPTGCLFFTCLLIGLIVGATIGATVSGVNAYNNGARGWELFGSILLGAVVGGVIGAAAGAIVGIGAELIAAGLPLIGSGLSGGMALVGGSVLSGGALVAVGVGAVAVGGATIATGILGGLLGLNILFARIDHHEEPNSTIRSGNSEAAYDENGNIIYRNDYAGKGHYDKGIGQYVPTPHSHRFIWKFVKGAWHIVKKFVLPL